MEYADPGYPVSDHHKKVCPDLGFLVPSEFHVFCPAYALFHAAIRLLEAVPDIQVTKRSPLYETAPYGYTDQPPFLNGCIGIETLYTPEELLRVLHEIEHKLGRKREIHWGPRTLDLDILFYDDLILDTPDLHIPHADMANREFVLQPLSDIAGDFRHPVINETVDALLAALKKQSK